MNIEDIKPYLEIAIKDSENKIFEYQSTNNAKYKIIFYKAIEFQEIDIFLYVRRTTDIKYKYYSIIKDGKINWDNCTLSREVKLYIERLYQLMIFA